MCTVIVVRTSIQQIITIEQKKRKGFPLFEKWKLLKLRDVWKKINIWKFRQDRSAFYKASPRDQVFTSENWIKKKIKSKTGFIKPDHYSKLCEITCNSSKISHDHMESKGYKARVEEKTCPPLCPTCTRSFHSQTILKGIATGWDYFLETFHSETNMN